VEQRAREELAGYYRHIEATDRAIGALVASVDQDAGRAGRSIPIVVVTSVHGDMHGAHGLFRKGWPYEESVRVPLLIRMPWEVGEPAPKEPNTHSSNDEAVSLLDLPAMALGWADARVQRVARPWNEISMPSVVALPYQCDRTWRGLRSKSRKLVMTETGSPWLFFDLEKDPWELKNLVDDPARKPEIELLRSMAGVYSGFNKGVAAT
jgi:arylsulfatase A-like enzyme